MKDNRKSKGIDNTVERRDFLSLMAGGALAASLAGLAGQANAQDDEELRIGYLPILTSSMLLIAHANGYFEEEGLKVAKPKLVRGWKGQVEGLTSGDLNLVHLLYPLAAFMRFTNNVPVKVIASGNSNGSSILVGKESGISGFADFADKRFAVPSPYSIHNIILQMELQNAGVKTTFLSSFNETPPAGTVGVSTMPPPDTAKAIVTKKIDGFSMAEPFNSMGETLAKGQILRFTGDIWRNHPCCALTMPEAHVVNNPERTQKITNAIAKAAVFLNQNKEEAGLILSREGKGYFPMPSAIVQKALLNYDATQYGAAIQHPEWNNARIDYNPYPYHSATTLLIDKLKETVVQQGDLASFPHSSDMAAKELVEASFIQKSLQNIAGWEGIVGADPASPFKREEIIAL